MNLREYLLKKKINHEEFAKKIGISRTTLHRIMKGETDPVLSIATKIVNATDGHVSYQDLKTDSKI